MEKLRFDNGYEMTPLPVGVLEYGTVLQLKCQLQGTMGEIDEQLNEAILGDLKLISEYGEVFANYNGYHEIISLAKQKMGEDYILRIVLQRTDIPDKEVIAELLKVLRESAIAEQQSSITEQRGQQQE